MVLPDEIRTAARNGHTAAIQAWFSTNDRDQWFSLDPDERDQFGTTLLFHAASASRCDTMRFLLGHGANVNATNSNGNTPLGGAADHGELDAAVLLLDRGAQIDLAYNICWTPLMRAALFGHCDMIRLLLSRGAALDARNNDGRDAETIARRFNNDDEAPALLADVRLAGGTWDAYLRYPRKRLLALRVLCERGRAMTDDDLLLRLFPWHPPIQDNATDESPSLRARAAQGPRELPKEVFWLVFKFWRSDRDSRY